MTNKCSFWQNRQINKRTKNKILQIHNQIEIWTDREIEIKSAVYYKTIYRLKGELRTNTNVFVCTKCSVLSYIVKV